MNSLLKAIIVDDEEKSRELLSKMVQKYCPGLIVAGMAESASSAVEMINSEKPDLVFLDIELSGESGFDVLNSFPEIHFDVIFTTAYDKYAIKAIKFSALDYLLKPIDSEELTAAVNRLIDKRKSRYSSENLHLLVQSLKKREGGFTKISLPTGNAYEIVNLGDIIRCESDGHYTNFILTGNRKVFVSVGLKYYEDILPEETFIRVHHSHLININHVVRFLKSDGGYAVMSDNSQVEISRRKKDFFLQRLQSLI
jgi:two-component system, LytTR family, response regulator